MAEGGGDVIVPSVNLRPLCVYGLRIDVIGNIQFSYNQEVIYPIEGVLAFHDFVENKQKFLRFPEDTHPIIIAVSPNRKLLAILERSPSTPLNTISIYDLTSLKKRRNLELPNDETKHFTVQEMLFTADNKTLLVLTKPPEDMIFMLVLDRTSSIIEARPTPPIARGNATCMASNPADTNLIVVGGRRLLCFQSKSEKGLAISNNTKCPYQITSLAFLALDLLLVGTANDLLILVENVDFKLIQKASDADFIDILMEQEQFAKELEQRIPLPLEGSALLDSKVICLTAFPTGFAFAIYNKVFVFEKVSKFKYERKTILRLPITLYDETLYQITNMAIDPKQEAVIVTTKHAQIYVGILIVPETLKAKQLKFEALGSSLHIDGITDISLCSWKPIIMTASKDQTIRIWNYETDKIELVRKFQVDVNVVELNSTGLLAAIGFSDQLRITEIFMDELNIVKTYNFPRCRDVKYSNYGHLMAAAYDNVIAITSVYNLEIVKELKGHNGIVMSVAFSKNDKYLISGGNEGAIYQWDVETGNRLQEIVKKGTEYTCVCVSFTEPLSIFAATNTGVLREFQNNEVVREVIIPSRTKSALTHVCMARSDMIMFVANDAGELVNIQVPFLDAGGGVCKNFRFFVSRINKIAFSYCNTMLMVITDSGTLAIFGLENIEGRVAPLDQDLLRSQEILIKRSILQEKNDQIANLELRLRQQAEEYQYQMSQNEIFDGQQLAEVHRSYCQALEELKGKNNEIEQRHTEEMNQITFQINDLKEDHNKQLDALANQYSERMLIEYQKFSNLRENMLKLREGYEDKLKKSAGTLQDTVEGLESDYKRQLDERRALIRELMKEMQDKKIEFIEYCRQVEVENDRNMVETQISYENKLTNERNETMLWRGKAGVLHKKYENLSKEIENLLEEVETLKEEHLKSKSNIGRLTRNIEDLQKDISDRDYAINSKEKRIQELLHKNQELDKYKQVLAHKIAELKAQIEPREFQINDKRKHILEMENELAGLNQNNMQLELQLKELKDKYLSNVAELKAEQHRARAGRECITNMCSEIYHVAGKINSPEKLKQAVKALFHKHASDEELKRYISLDAKVRDEFQRQRAYIEDVLEIYKNRAEDKSQKSKYDKLFKENLFLLETIDKLTDENKDLRGRLKKAFQDVTKHKKKPTTK